MFRKCPKCASLDVRRSSSQNVVGSAWLGLRSPYRCCRCGEPFWVLSSKARTAAVVACGLIVVGVTLFGVFAWLFDE
jgi:transposase-like protein